MEMEWETPSSPSGAMSPGDSMDWSPTPAATTIPGPAFAPVPRPVFRLPLGDTGAFRRFGNVSFNPARSSGRSFNPEFFGHAPSVPAASLRDGKLSGKRSEAVYSAGYVPRRVEASLATSENVPVSPAGKRRYDDYQSNEPETAQILAQAKRRAIMPGTFPESEPAAEHEPETELVEPEAEHEPEAERALGPTLLDLPPSPFLSSWPAGDDIKPLSLSTDTPTIVTDSSTVARRTMKDPEDWEPNFGASFLPNDDDWEPTFPTYDFPGSVCAISQPTFFFRPVTCIRPVEVQELAIAPPSESKHAPIASVPAALAGPAKDQDVAMHRPPASNHASIAVIPTTVESSAPLEVNPATDEPSTPPAGLAPPTALAHLIDASLIFAPVLPIAAQYLGRVMEAGRVVASQFAGAGRALTRHLQRPDRLDPGRVEIAGGDTAGVDSAPVDTPRRSPGLLVENPSERDLTDHARIDTAHVDTWSRPPDLLVDGSDHALIHTTYVDTDRHDPARNTQRSSPGLLIDEPSDHNLTHTSRIDTGRHDPSRDTRKSSPDVLVEEPSDQELRATRIDPGRSECQRSSPDILVEEPSVRELGQRYRLFRLSGEFIEDNKMKEEEERKHNAEVQAQLIREATESRKRQSIIVPLSYEWNAKVDKAMEKKSHLAEITPSLNRKDFGTLLPTTRADGNGWLNDEIVNQYLSAIIQKGLDDNGYTKKAKEPPKFHNFSTHLYSTYQAKGFDAVQKWVSRAKIHGKRLLDTEKVLIPINESLHWTLICVSGVNRTVEYYDSLGGNPKRYTKFALDFVRNVLGSDFKEKEWKIINVSSAQQANALDCGVFVCMNGLALMMGRNSEEAIDAADIPAARRMIAATFLNGGCSGELAY